MNLKLNLTVNDYIHQHNVKYLSLLIDPNLSWSFHMKSLASKLTRAISMLAKIRHYVDQSTLRSIYFSIFSSILKYGCQIWSQDQIIKSNLKRIMKVQNKALRIINFADFNIPSSPLYKTSNILKLKDHVTLNNFLYVHDSFTSNIPSSLRNIFSCINSRHEYPTRISQKMCVNLPISRTMNYGIFIVYFFDFVILNCIYIY